MLPIKKRHMKLSVIIVNYNVKYFLTQCLLSVEKAEKEFAKQYGKNQTEIFVVDNNSIDDSCRTVKEKFPGVILIENKKNVGFSKANNQAIRQSSGEYVLLLNPDTVVPEDTFTKTIEFADKHPEAGGIGVKMIDGNGNFLPESKRAFPSPEVSFYKMFGLSKIFPSSKRFGKYHLSYIDENKTSEVDVLAGAFMLLRKKTLDKTGLLDEDFFMYGEDIDLSYRITQAGFSNWYFPETPIIHYKGESTKKGSLNYVYVFYNAMLIFAKKHFKEKKYIFYSFFIKIAVVLRAIMSAFKRIFNFLFLPLCDALVIFSGFYILKPLWEKIKFHETGHYPPEYLTYAVPSYIIIWISAIIFAKAYRFPPDSKRLFKGILSGTFLILIIYSLLNENYRYSRLLILAGTAWAMFFSWLVRALFTLAGTEKFAFRKKKHIKTAYVVKPDEFLKSAEILEKYCENKSENILIKENTYPEIKEKLEKEHFDKTVLSPGKLSYKNIIKIISQKSAEEYEIAYPDIGFIIGSRKVYVDNYLFEALNFDIEKRTNRIAKRIFDIIASLLFLILSPVLVLLVDDKKNYFTNIFHVLKGKLSFVGYIDCDKCPETEKLPEIKKGILHPVTYPVYDADETVKINFRYAKNYHITDDIYAVYKSFDKISNKKL